MALIKDIYSPRFFGHLAERLSLVLPHFVPSRFLSRVMDSSFQGMEFKERMKHTTQVLHGFMPGTFGEAAEVILKLVEVLENDPDTGGRLEYIFLPDYVETYGLSDLDTAARVFERLTQFISCEFAVRPFLVRYEEKMLVYMTAWSLHENAHVRRLASEGARPRLPWAMALPAYKKDPSPLLPILENLKNDPSEWVRRSVANHLNDIAKDHPDVVTTLVRQWKGQSRLTDAILKHGSRTLLKQGHPVILTLFGFTPVEAGLSDFTIETPQVRFGETLQFSFSVHNKSPAPRTIRIEYAVYHKRARGHFSKKVFKLSERRYQAGETVRITRKHPFKPITTRAFYAGTHRLSVILNGLEQTPELSFELEI